ncbi:MAG TPA: aldo/keto reductase [Solirubrobacterales bacterium]|nr:aldo/keto reductase [Solirubrobacterales bacterium]
MEFRQIGSLNVSVVGLGCNNFGQRLDYEGTAAVIDAALDAGVNFLDTADIYGGTKSEELLGRALRGRRERVVLATKFGMKVAGDERRKGAKPDYVHRALDASLSRLQTDHVDLYWLHQPDPETPIAETLAALDEEVQAGRVREIGCSNFNAEQLRQASAAVRDGAARFVAVQNEYSLLHRDPEREVLAECERQGLALVPYFPLASGLLTGKYRPGQPPPQGTRLAGGNSRFLNDRNLEAAEALRQFAESRGHTLLELAFSWLLARPQVASVIAGATKPDQVRANVAAATWRITSEELEEVDRLAPLAPAEELVGR